MVDYYTTPTAKKTSIALPQNQKPGKKDKAKIPGECAQALGRSRDYLARPRSLVKPAALPDMAT